MFDCELIELTPAERVAIAQRILAHELIEAMPERGLEEMQAKLIELIEYYGPALGFQEPVKERADESSNC